MDVQGLAKIAQDDQLQEDFRNILRGGEPALAALFDDVPEELRAHIAELWDSKAEVRAFLHRRERGVLNAPNRAARESAMLQLNSMFLLVFAFGYTDRLTNEQVAAPDTEAEALPTRVGNPPDWWQWFKARLHR
jgi:hypothetical protein